MGFCVEKGFSEAEHGSKISSQKSHAIMPSSSSHGDGQICSYLLCTSCLHIVAAESTGAADALCGREGEKMN